jgi:hypothetical protein
MLSPYLTDIPINSSQISNIEIDRLRKKKVPKTTMPQSRKARTSSSETQTLNSPRSIKTMYPQRSPQVAFTSTSERFNTYFIEATDPENPGPGTYNFKSTFSTAGKTSFSSKGFGNGFLSKEGRFIDENKLYYEKYKPGPGEYNNNKNSLVNEVKNSLIGKSLYNKKENKSLKNKEVRPDPFSYEPKRINSESYNYESVFKAKDKRFKIRFNSNPGPGTYNSLSDNFKSDKIESSMFKKPLSKRIDILKKLNIKTDKEVNDEYIDNKIKKSGEHPISFANIRQKDFYLTSVDPYENEENDKKKNKKSEENKKSNINNLGENFEPNKNKQQFEIINLDKKNDLMKLAAPRWKNNKYEFKVPGPAFYHPPLLDNHLSFNRNENIFIGGTGALYNLLYK